MTDTTKRAAIVKRIEGLSQDIRLLEEQLLAHRTSGKDEAAPDYTKGRAQLVQLKAARQEQFAALEAHPVEGSVGFKAAK